MSSADLPPSAASRWQAPAEPPPVGFDVRAELAARTLAGSGLEIGALHQPLTVTRDVAVSYVDRMTVEQLREHYPELERARPRRGRRRRRRRDAATVADGSQDFIVANHFLEHTGDPISTIETHLRKLAPGGALFYAVPDKRYTFDVARAVTPVEHMLRDRAEGPGVSREEHYEDWARHVYGSPADPPRSEAEIARLARDLEQRDYSIHTHVWTQAEFIQLLLTCRELFGEQFDLEAVWKAGMELLVVLRKAGAAPIAPRGEGGPAARPALARSDVGAYISDLELAVRQRDRELAELRAELVLERARTRELMSSPAWKAGRPLRGAQRAVELTRRRWQERQRDGEGVAIALAGLAPELDGGWPEQARWHPAAELPGGRGAALEQPFGERIAYRLTLPAGARLRCDVALPLLTWSDCNGGVAFEATLEALDGSVLGRWRAAVDGANDGGWRRVALDADFALTAPREVVLALSLAWTGDPPAGLGADRGLWIEPRLLLPEEAIGAVAPAPADAARAARAVADAAQPAPQAVAERADGPLISLLTPVHDPDPAFLEQLLDQVERQSFDDWQLCLVDDGSKDPRVLELIERRVAAEPRIVLRRHESARGIVGATNAALELAVGTFVAFLDHDDVLPTDALATVAEAIAAAPRTDLLYSDEDHILHNGRRFAPYLKPDWSPDLLRSIMFTGHLGVIRRALVEQLGGLREQFEGSQDYDLVLRASERTDRIAHLPRVLYHWRVHERSTASGEAAKPYAYEAARRALDEHLQRLGVAGHVEPADAPGRYRIVHELPSGTSIALLLALDEQLTRPGWEQSLTHCAATWDSPHAAPAFVLAGTAERVAAAQRRSPRPASRPVGSVPSSATSASARGCSPPPRAPPRISTCSSGSTRSLPSSRTRASG